MVHETVLSETKFGPSLMDNRLNRTQNHSQSYSEAPRGLAFWVGCPMVEPTERRHFLSRPGTVHDPVLGHSLNIMSIPYYEDPETTPNPNPRFFTKSLVRAKTCSRCGLESLSFQRETGFLSKDSLPVAQSEVENCQTLLAGADLGS